MSALAIPAEMTDLLKIDRYLWDQATPIQVRERQYKRTHDVFVGAPSEWAEERGATHTLWCGIGLGKGSRPAKLLKTILYVGVDESDDQIVWEKWEIKTL